MVQNNTDMNVVSSCLDATFTQKRTWVNKFPVDRIARIATVFEKYPCFSNVTMIVGEIARVLKSAVTVDSARVSLAEEIDTFLYYRIHKLVILRPLPPKSNTDTKVKHLMNYLLQLFINESSKKKKTKTGHIVLEKTMKARQTLD
ncbi:uncharacterized protein LOC136082408 isoform X2 [Hydra vulgaris]|uniref:Uncharacterized protein LOC136082408 isoform X2 n=1 Tax=Hydra vulgaris TaxID=6087 RepID=A0ABM4C7X4_HYDVU